MGGGDPRAPSNPMIVDFLDDWDLVSGVRLHEMEDIITWKLNNAGMNTSRLKGSYDAPRGVGVIRCYPKL
jgi:hypothetical protein